MKPVVRVSLAFPCFFVLAIAACVGDDPLGSSGGTNNGDGGPGSSGGLDGASADGSSGGGGDGGGTDGGDAGEIVPPHVPVVGNFIKASNTKAAAAFGNPIAVSADGNTIAVGSPGEKSSATGVNPGAPAQDDASRTYAGAVYVFMRSGPNAAWEQKAYIKPDVVPNDYYQFGYSVALSADGRRLAVGAQGDDGAVLNGGAVYVYRFNISWFREAGPLRPTNAMADASFGSSVALSGDGETLAVGASQEDGNASGVADATYDRSGAVVVFSAGGGWHETNYIKPSNNRASNVFGWSVALSGDGTVLGITAPGEQSNAKGVSGSASTDASLTNAGAAYIFTKEGTSWAQSVYLKAKNTRQNARFGRSIAIAANGETLVVGSPTESSGAKGVDNTAPGDTDTTASESGAAYVFSKNANVWSQSAYIKPSNTRSGSWFGNRLGLSIDGKSLIVGSSSENSGAAGINPKAPALGEDDTSIPNAGAAYTFGLVGGKWTQTAYLKSWVAGPNNFGADVGITNGAATVVVGASTERSNTTGIDPATNTLASGSGAVYTFK
jgi:trimeric autotransporter adhesin